jgi:hypothetical protein
VPVSTHNDFSAGMMVDPLPGQLPEKAVADALDVLFDTPGMVRTRSGTSSPTASALTAVANSIGTILGSNVALPYGMKTNGTLGIFDVNGVFRDLGTSAAPNYTGRPVQFLGNLLFPSYNGSSQSFVMTVGGADDTGFNTYSPPAGTVATVTAGSSQVNFTAGAFDTSTQINGNQYILITNSASSATREIYLGRFQASAPHVIVVDPVPTRSFTATQGASVGTFVQSVYSSFDLAANPNSQLTYGAKCAAVHQNRVLLGNVGQFNTSTSLNQPYPRRVFYSILPNEAPSANTNAQGQSWMFRESIEANNYFEIGGGDPIVALVPIDDNELLVFTNTSAWRLTGYLATRVSNDAGGVTFDLHPIPGAPGLLHERAWQQTPHGVILASDDDLYLYSGGRFQHLLGAANSQYWRGLLRNRVLLGSHLLNDDYYVVSVGTDGASGGGGGATTTLAYHIPTRTLSRLSGNTLVLFDAVRNPFKQQKRIGLRWWDTTLTAPSMTGGQVVYTDGVTSTGISSAPDVDAHVIAASLTTRVYDEGSPTQPKRFWRTVWRTGGGPAISVLRAENIGTLPGVTIGTPTNTFVDYASFSGPVVHTPGVQYILSSSTGFALYGFDHYFDPIPYAKAS